MKEGYFEPRGISYRMSELKPGAPVLVFIHGLTGSASAWYEYEALFEERFTMVTMDLRGHGKSKKYARLEDYAIAEFTRDISELLAFLEVTDYILISHSLGTLVALELAAKKNVPVMLMSTNYDIRSIWLRKLLQPLVLACATLLRIFPVLKNTGERTDYTRYHGTGDWNFRRIFIDIRNATLRVYIFCNLHVYYFRQNELWKSLGAPVYIVHGERDSVVPVRNAIRLSKIIPHSELFIIKDANHILVINEVEMISGLISGFVSTVLHDVQIDKFRQ